MMYVCMYVRNYARMYLCMMHACKSMYVCVYVYVCAIIYLAPFESLKKAMKHGKILTQESEEFILR